jgi:hypothetical protein
MIEHISTPMIHTPGGNITTKQTSHAPPPLNLVGRLYKTNLIVMEGQGIDVILGMD